MYPRRNIHKYIWTPDGKTHNQIHYILINKGWHLCILNVRSFRGDNCGPYHYLVVAKARERLAVSKQAAQKFDVVRFNIRKLSEVEVRKQYHIKMPNLFSALENLNDSDDINRAWENIEENIKTSAKESLGLYELKQHKP